MPSNLRNIVMKLPYKLREKWRSVACDLQEQNGCRAVSGMEMNDFIELPNVLTQQEDIAKWSYLRDIKLHGVDAEVDLLIGTDAPKIIEPWELINSQRDGPYTV